jgi:hypothetical protein
MPGDSWNLAPGLNNVGSFQVSGRPFVSGSCLAPASGSTSLVVRFPSTTKWVQIEPLSGSGQSIRVAFSENGLHGKGGSSGTPGEIADGYNFRIHPSSSFCRPIDMKVGELWFMSEDSATVRFDVMAGVTNIPSSRLQTLRRDVNGTIEAGGPNWSGSIGVG